MFPLKFFARLLLTPALFVDFARLSALSAATPASPTTEIAHGHHDTFIGPITGRGGSVDRDCQCGVADLRFYEPIYGSLIRNGSVIRRGPLELHDERGSTHTCDKECLKNWGICDERYCCPSCMLDELRDDGLWAGFGWDRMRDTLKKIRKGTQKTEVSPNKGEEERLCREKPVGPDDCSEGEAIACYWKDFDGPPMHCLTWHATGGETTNFYVALRPGDVAEAANRQHDEMFKIISENG